MKIQPDEKKYDLFAMSPSHFYGVVSCAIKLNKCCNNLAAYSPITLVFLAMGFSCYHIALAGLLQHAFTLFYCT